MNTVFESAIIKHTSGKPNSFKAAMKVLPAEGFASAIEEISQWQGYEPTPLFSLKKDRKSTRLNSSHVVISYAVFCLKKKNHKIRRAQV